MLRAGWWLLTLGALLLIFSMVQERAVTQIANAARGR